MGGTCKGRSRCPIMGRAVTITSPRSSLGAAAMINSYDREELVARFGPRSFCGSVDDTVPVPAASWNKRELDRATRESASKPPTPQWFDWQRKGGLPIKPND